MGWYQDAYRHSLAAKGVKTKLKVHDPKVSVGAWRKKHPELVKDFPGDNPDLTKNYARFRQEDPKKFSEFRTKEMPGGKILVFGKKKGSDRWALQSVMIKRYSAAGKVHTGVQDPLEAKIW